jgi:CRISPR-associated protein Csd2
MGRKHIVPYGLYRTRGFVSANLAERTGFSDDDLGLFWDALKTMFDHDRSAARGEMTARKLFVFKHETALGNAPAHKLFEAVKVVRKADVKVPRTFGDYGISFDKGALPSRVEAQELL